MAPSRSPHSLTTNRPTPSSDATVASTAAPTGSSGARRACIPGKGEPGSKVEPRQLVGELDDLIGGQLDLVDLARPRRRPASGPGRGQAGQGTDGAPAHHGPVGDALILGHGAARWVPWLRPCGPAGRTDRPPRVGRRFRAPLAAGRGRSPRSWPATTWRSVAHRRFEAPTAEVHPERRARAGPHPGALPDETQPCLLLPPEDEHLGAHHPFAGARRPRRCWRRRAAPRWPGPRRSRHAIPPARHAAVWQPPPTPPPGHEGWRRAAPTLRPKFRRARRCNTGVSERPGPASQTRRWKELLPRSHTAARTPTART